MREQRLETRTGPSRVGDSDVVVADRSVSERTKTPSMGQDRRKAATTDTAKRRSRPGLANVVVQVTVQVPLAMDLRRRRGSRSYR